MTVRLILDTKGHQITSVEPEARLSAAVKILGERKIGAVLVMSAGGSRVSCRSVTSSAFWANVGPPSLKNRSAR